MAATMSDFLRSGGMVRSLSGAPFRVSPTHVGRFGGMLSDLERYGVKIDPSQSGGFANRNIAGTNVPSQHSFGRAVDVNWRDNPRGPMAPQPQLAYDMYGEDARQPTTRIHPDIANDIAQRHGMAWGGNWSNPDPMHFEVGRGNLPPVPVQNRSITGFAGAPPPAQSPAQPSPQPPPVTPPPHSATPGPNPDAIVAGAQQAQAENNIGVWDTTTKAEPSDMQKAFGRALMAGDAPQGGGSPVAAPPPMMSTPRPRPDTVQPSRLPMPTLASLLRGV